MAGRDFFIDLQWVIWWIVRCPNPAARGGGALMAQACLGMASGGRDRAHHDGTAGERKRWGGGGVSGRCALLWGGGGVDENHPLRG